MSLKKLFYFIILALFLYISTGAVAGPPDEYSAIFDPVDTMLAPCMERGEHCLAEGRERGECEGVVEACLGELDNKAREALYVKRLGSDEDASAESKVVAACEDIIKECFEETRDMDSCIVGVLQCREDGKEEPYPCCPGVCVHDYKGLVNSGSSDIDTFFTVFVSGKTGCFTNKTQ